MKLLEKRRQVPRAYPKYEAQYSNVYPSTQHSYLSGKHRGGERNLPHPCTCSLADKQNTGAQIPEVFPILGAKAPGGDNDTMARHLYALESVWSKSAWRIKNNDS